MCDRALCSCRAGCFKSWENETDLTMQARNPYVGQLVFRRLVVFVFAITKAELCLMLKRRLLAP